MTPLRLNLNRALYVAMAALSITLPLITLDYSVSRRLPPDLFYALSLCWIIRQDRSANMPLVAGMALLADFVLMRPVGLGALLMLLTSEVARNNARILREQTFLLEWLVVGVGFALMMLAQNILLTLAFADRLPIAAIGQISLSTVLCYPIIAGLLYYVLRIRSASGPARTDRLGRVA